MKVLHIDIETAPIEAHVWGMWQQNVGLNQVQKNPRMLCFATKWHGVKGVDFFSEWGNGRVAMLQAAHDLLSEADVIVHYNGKRFDTPWLNAEFVVEGFGPPAPFQQIDLCNVVKRRFRFPSNKLQYVSERLGIGSKVSHEGHALWTKCLNGDVKAQKAMEKYNRQDTVLLEKLYNKLLPWIPSVPNRLLYGAEPDACPSCGVAGALRKEGTRSTGVATFQRYKCRNCNSWSTSGKALTRVDTRGHTA